MKKFLKWAIDNFETLPISHPVMHYIGGAIVALVMLLLMCLDQHFWPACNDLFLIPYFAFPFGMLLVTAVAAGWKEVQFDGRWGYGVPSWGDFWNSMKGGLVVSLIAWVVIWAFHLYPPCQYEPTLNQVMNKWESQREQRLYEDSINKPHFDSLIWRSDSLKNALIAKDTIK